MHRVALASVLLALTAGRASAQADTCANATPITGTGAWPFDLRAAGVDNPPEVFGEFCHIVHSGQNLHFQWTVPADGAYRFSLLADPGSEPTNITRGVVVYDGPDCSAPCFATSNWYDTEGDCAAALNTGFLQAGDVYAVMIFGWMFGDFEIARVSPPPPNDTCATPTVLTGIGPWSFDSTNATSSRTSLPNNSCLAPLTNDLFFSWVAPAPGRYLVQVEFDDARANLVAYDGAQGCTVSCLLGQPYPPEGDPALSMELVVPAAGSPFVFAVGGYRCMESGPGELRILPDPGPTPGDDCSAPISISGVGTFEYDPIWAEDSTFQGSAALCTFDPSQRRDRFFVWTALEDGAFVFDCDLVPEDFLGFRVFDGVDCNASCVDRPGANGRAVTRVLAAGDAVLVQCGSSLTDTFGSSPSTMQVRRERPGNRCASAIPIVGEGVWSYDQTAMGQTHLGPGAGTCHPDEGFGDDIYFRWTVPCAGDFRFEVDGPGSFPNVSINVYEADGCDLTCLAGDAGINGPDRATVLGLEAGVELVIRTSDGEFYATDQMGTLSIARLGGSACGALSTSCAATTPHHEGGFVTLGSSSFQGGLATGLHLEARGGPEDAFGFFLVGATADASLPVFRGTLCLDLPFGRYGPTAAMNQNQPALNSLGRFGADGVFENIVGTSASGTGFDVPGVLPAPLAGGTAPGTMWSFQMWYRDLDDQGGPSANLSDVLHASFQ